MLNSCWPNTSHFERTVFLMEIRRRTSRWVSWWDSGHRRSWTLATREDLRMSSMLETLEFKCHVPVVTPILPILQTGTLFTFACGTNRCKGGAYPSGFWIIINPTISQFFSWRVYLFRPGSSYLYFFFFTTTLRRAVVKKNSRISGTWT